MGRSSTRLIKKSEMPRLNPNPGNTRLVAGALSRFAGRSERSVVAMDQLRIP
jgi:hypothetical protein